MPRRLVTDPLLHFLLLGALLFVADSLWNRAPRPDEHQSIVVERNDLLSFLQYRAHAFDDARFEAILNGMSAKALSQLTNEFVREEALYREARMLQLDRYDYASRRRLIQQLEFLMEGLVEPGKPTTDEELAAYYKAHGSRYNKRPSVTFAHVFVSNDIRGRDSERRAHSMLKQLNDSSVRFDQAMSHGDRFLYRVNYADKEEDLVASHFGEEMRDALFTMQPASGLWRGPLRSPYGFHLVMVTGRTESTTRPLEDVRERVTQDFELAHQRELLDARLQEIVDAYDIQFAADLDKQIATASLATRERP